MSIEAMKQALEALESLQELCSEESGFVEQVTIWTPEAITALRAAIEQAEKPVECMCGVCKLGKREWVGLTEIEICDIEADELTSASSETFSFARAIEAKLKEKNT
jgi:hypothetical protein